MDGWMERQEEAPDSSLIGGRRCLWRQWGEDQLSSSRTVCKRLIAASIHPPVPPIYHDARWRHQPDDRLRNPSKKSSSSRCRRLLQLDLMKCAGADLVREAPEGRRFERQARLTRVSFCAIPASQEFPKLDNHVELQ